MHKTQVEDVVPVGTARVATLQGRPNCGPSFRTAQITPYVQAFVLLEGEQHFRVDDKTFSFTAEQYDGCQPVAGLFCVTKPSALTFLTETDSLMRKVRVSAPMSWISSLAGEHGTRLPELTRFFTQHLNHHAFPATAHLIHLAEQVLDPPAMLQGELRTLYRQSRGLEIISHVLRELVDSEGRDCMRATTNALKISSGARDLILNNLQLDFDIDTIARAVGASKSLLQRVFKDCYGLTVMDFIRRSRLEAAHDALERGGVTIAQAAHLAGYAHHSNFTTAFKRTYGIPPKLTRR